MRLVAVLNREIKLGQAFNALAHMTFGLGHRIAGMPSIDVYFGDSKQVREFRAVAAHIVREEAKPAAFSDFPHTMSGGDSAHQLAVGAATPEKDITYFAACIMAPEIDARLLAITSTCMRLRDYAPLVSSDEARLLEPRRDYDTTTVGKKIVMVLNMARALPEVLNAMVHCSLAVGGRADFSTIRLVGVPDGDGGIHENISFHTYPIVSAKDDAHRRIADASAKHGGLTSMTAADDKGPLITVAFGDLSEVELTVPKTDTRLFSNELSKKALVAVEGGVDAKAAVAGAGAVAKVAEAKGAAGGAKSTERPAAALFVAAGGTSTGGATAGCGAVGGGVAASADDAKSALRVG